MNKFLIPLIVIFFSCNTTEKQTEEIKDSLSVTSNTESTGSHYLHELKYGRLESVSEDYWDSINGTGKLSKLHNNYDLDSKYKTFGWHLYSGGSAYKNYNFSLLWGIAYFAYIINPENGSYKNIHQWKTTELIDRAKAHDCKIFLTVANFGKEDNTSFLNNPKSQETLIDSVLSLLALRKADGINIDFESLSAENKPKFNKFIKIISERLKKENPDYMVSLCLYAVDYHNIFEIKTIDPYIDFYTMMGYDYYGSFSKHAGPVSPLYKTKTFGEHCLESSVDYYISKGVNPSKLIVGLPNYGAEWIVNNTVIPSKAEKFYSHAIYKTIKKVYTDSLNLPILFDSACVSNYINIKDNDGDRQLWFNDVKSFAVKYDWIKSRKLGGVGIWALGYDDGNEELWNLLAEKFSKKE